MGTLEQHTMSSTESRTVKIGNRQLANDGVLDTHRECEHDDQ